MPQKKTRQDAPPLEADPHVELSALRDGTILTSSADGAPYLYQGGRRKRILSPAVVLAAGVDVHPSKVQQVTLSEEELQRIPAAGPLAPAGTRQFDSGLMHLGANHWMRTWGVLDLGTGQVPPRPARPPSPGSVAITARRTSSSVTRTTHPSSSPDSTATAWTER
ncbi:hypothetical protein [Streptomyces nigra]|uniref:hypothetical protein n=1 Tax=Streptomyces nigra TaxID=1827580 RepID=UPI003638059E